MLNPDHFAVTLARAVDVFHRRPDAKDEQKAVLRAVVALCKLDEVALSTDGKAITVGGTSVPPGLPGIADLAQRLGTRGVTAVAIRKDPAPADLLGLLRALAGAPGQAAIPAGGSVTVTVQPVAAVPPVQAPASPKLEADVLTGEHALVDIMAAVSPDTELGHVLEALARDPYGADVLGRASAVTARIQDEFNADRREAAVEALAAVINLERDAQEDARRHYAIVLQRALTPSALGHAAETALDHRHVEAAMTVLLRAGENGTATLVQRLESADGVTERKAYLDVLKRIGPQPPLLLPMLNHSQWYVVEAAAELLGDLAVEEAVVPLGRALHHKHLKVREAAAGALARVATGPALDQLRQALGADRDDVRQAVARSIGSRASSALAMPLVNLAEDKDVSLETMRECYRALVRIGSSSALNAVLTAAEPGGRMLGRKPTPRRVAAVEALALSRDAAVRRKLQELAAEDREKPVRDAAARALTGAGTE